jgi:hypothetical protein
MLDPQQHDFDKDELSPRAVHEQLKAHDKRMKQARSDLAQAKALYMTRWWRYVRGRADERQMRTLNTDVEVNKIWGAIGSYLSALYPRANRAVFGPDVTGRGNPERAQLALNHWLGSQKIHARVMSALRQAILYPGCAAKIGYSPGSSSPLDRVWMRIIPWWEVVLDADATDPDDERFRGHVYYRPIQEVEREYDIPKGMLTGTSRKDFLSPTQSVSEEPHKREQSNADAISDGAAFVRVLELCNLKDTIQDPNDPSVTYLGRLEVYVLNQGDLSLKPVYMGPLPLAEASGVGLPHITPLIFASEPEFPLRGIAGSQRMLPQLREINIYRSFMAQSTRKDSRQYLIRDGILGADNETKLVEGVDGLLIKVPSDYNGALGDVMQKIETGTVSVNVQNYMAMAEADLERAIGMSPNARGIITKATAFEMQTTQLYTESEFGMHGMIKDAWLADVVKLAQRALLAAMQNPEEGSLGEYDDAGQVELSPTDARPIDQEEPNPAQAAHLIASDLAGAVAPFLSGPPKPKYSGNLIVIQQDVLRLVDRGEPVEVTVQDLDADFTIAFVEGGRTPMTDAAMQQNLVSLMGPYMQLWEAAQQPGPAGVIARTYMATIADRFELPKDLHPDNLDQKVKEDAKKNPAPPAPAAPPEGGPPAPPAPPEGAPPAPPSEGEAGLPPAPAPEGMGEGEDSENLETPKEYLDSAAGTLDTLLNTPGLPAEVQDVLVQVAEAVVAAGRTEDDAEAAAELEGAMATLGGLASTEMEPDLKEVLDELAEDLDEAIGLFKGMPEGDEGEGYEEDEGTDEAAKSEGESCPRATQDIALNLENRQHAIDTAMYGPANPNEPGDYFDQIAAKWGVPVETAMTMRCGNCAAFYVTPSILQCIKKGLDAGGGPDSYDVIIQAELGYCEAFDFKCAASRTCSAWVTGGPVTEEKPHG